MSENMKTAPQVHHFKKPKSGNQDHSVHQTTPFQIFSVIMLVVLAILEIIGILCILGWWLQ